MIARHFGEAALPAFYAPAAYSATLSASVKRPGAIGMARARHRRSQLPCNPYLPMVRLGFFPCRRDATSTGRGTGREGHRLRESQMV